MAYPVPTHGTDGIHAETKTRDTHFVMEGHHCHSCYELFYVESGECRFLIDDHIFDLHPGNCILVPPMTLHYTRYMSGPCRRTVLLFRGSDIEEEVRQCMPHPLQFFSESSLFQVPEASRAQVAAVLSEMAAEERIRDSRSALLQKMRLQTLLLLCSRVCSFVFDPPADIRTNDRQILQAARFISQRFADSLTSADVARAVGFSPNYLSRKFRAATGIGLHEYIVFVRLQRAAQELLSTDDSITAIALRCGFSDSNYFKDAFKKKYGVSPRSYRKIT